VAPSGDPSDTTKGGIAMTQAYCMKCRKKVEIRNPLRVTLKNKRPATRGTCPSCGTKVFRIGKA
jgi:RNase P subunit RPR2